MKRILSIVICMLLLVSTICVTVSAETTEGVLELPMDDGTGYPVTGISDSYSGDENATKIIVPENIVRLGDEAFYGCVNVNQIKLHSKLQRIGERVFEKTAYFEDKDNWEDGVLYIGDCLIKADPENVPENYEVRIGTRLIAAGAFRDCKTLSSIIIPDTLEYVGENAFAGTEFFNNKQNWSQGALIIDHVFVAADETLTGVCSIPEGIRTIADGAFSHSKITELTTPDSLKHIGYNAFWDSQELTKVYLGLNVETLGRGPFRMCDNLQEITVHEDNESYSVVDGVLYNNSLSAVIRCPEKKAGDVSLPHSIKKIDAYAFEWCTEITSVAIPEGCVFIGNASFSTCENLSDITLPESLEYLDNSAFSYCNSIESITVPDNVYYLGKWAFSCCMGLKEVTIGNKVDKLRYGLFESCEKLNRVNLGENIEEIDETAFVFSNYVSNVNNYRNGLLISSDKYLIKVAKDVTECYVPSGVTVIADGAFEYPTEEGYISEVHIPSSLKRFNWGAFYDIKETPIYYDGTIHDFIGVTTFDWDCINLYTKDFTSGIWIVVTLFGVFALSTAGILIANILRKRNEVEETEEEYGEE